MPARSPLTKQQLYERALAIVDEEGLESLSMRRLAADVGVKAPSLYNHVTSKEDLIDGVLRLMRSEVNPPEPPPHDWMTLMEVILTEYRRVLAAHPNMMPLAGRRLPGDDQSGLAFLSDQGFTPDEAVELWQALVAFVVGFSLLGSDDTPANTSGLSDELSARAAEWRDETCTKALRMIMEAFEARRAAALPR